MRATFSTDQCSQSLLQSSRGLYLATEQVGFWLIVAKTIDVSVHPLPLPPFRTLQSLTLQELKAVCSRAQRIHSNLLRSDPDLRQDVCFRTAELGKGARGGIYHFAFLPGGRHVLVLTVRGLVTCWDIEGELARSDAGGGGERKVVGQVLASHESKLRPLMWNFCADGENVLIAVYGTVPG